MEIIIEYLILLLLIVGSTFILIASIGLLKMPDVYLRMSASTIAATLGIFLILIACALHFKDLKVALHVLGIIIFLILTVPVGAHLMARASYICKLPMWEKTQCDDLKGKYDKDCNQFRSTDDVINKDCSKKSI